MNKKKLGYHLNNWHKVDDPTWDLFRDTDPACFTCMAGTGRGDMEKLSQLFPQATIICRVYDGGGLNEEIFSSSYSLWLLAREFFPNDQVIMTLSNEPNIESYGQSADGIKRFHDDWLRGYDWIKNQERGREIIWAFTPMAPGNKDIPVIQDPPGTLTYMEYCQDLIAMCDIVALHIYAEYPSLVLDPWFGNRIVQYKKWCQGKPIIIKESAMSVKDQTVRGEWTVKWFRELIEPDPQIRFVTQWIAGVRDLVDPAFGENCHLGYGGGRLPVANAIVEYVKTPNVPVWPPIEPPVEPPAEGDEMDEQMHAAFDEFVKSELVRANPAMALEWLKRGGITNECLGGYMAYMAGQGQIPASEAVLAGMKSLVNSRLDEFILLAKKA